MRQEEAKSTPAARVASSSSSQVWLQYIQRAGQPKRRSKPFVKAADEQLPMAARIGLSQCCARVAWHKKLYRPPNFTESGVRNASCARWVTEIIAWYSLIRRLVFCEGTSIGSIFSNACCVNLEKSDVLAFDLAIIRGSRDGNTGFLHGISFLAEDIYCAYHLFVSRLFVPTDAHFSSERRRIHNAFQTIR